MGALAKHYYSLIKAGRASNKEKAKKEEQEPIFERIEKSNQDSGGLLFRRDSRRSVRVFVFAVRRGQK